MRLKAMKLSGFKSFVDLTHIVLKGEIIAVVGPNGCGKSNIIDAIKWVLGESRQSTLRSQSMQDLIFSGSAHRKAVSRASVELSFDNQEAASSSTLWSQYTDVAIKRVITRQGDSTYWINNVPVRKKDVTDLFLGTGIGGGRSYAIVEQGMISKIIEATPDEVRFFLEEAAGVSRYQEKRRETEARLKDSQLNLDRLSDILVELSGRREALQGQAEKALRYMDIEDSIQLISLRLYSAQFFFAQKALALNAEETALLVEELSKENISMAQLESVIKEKESAYYEAQKALSDTQESFRVLSTELAQKEKDHFYRAEKIQENQQLLGEIARESAHLEERLVQLRDRESSFKSVLVSLDSDYAVAQKKTEEMRTQVGICEARKGQAHKRLRDQEAELQGSLSQSQYLFAELSALRKRVEESRYRYEQLVSEKLALVFEGASAIAEAKTALQQLAIEKADIDQEVLALLEQEKAAQARLLEMKLLQQTQTKQLAQLEGKKGFIEQERKRLYALEDVENVLDTISLAIAEPIVAWLDVDPVWMTALDVLLSYRLSAYGIDDLRALKDKMASGVRWSKATMFFEVAESSCAVSWAQWSPYIVINDNAPKAINEILSICLSSYYPISDVDEAFDCYRELALDQAFVLPSGDILGRKTLCLSAQSSVHAEGFLHREAEWRALLNDISQQQLAVSALQTDIVSQESLLEAISKEKRRYVSMKEQVLITERAHENRLLLLSEQKKTIEVRRQEKDKERWRVMEAMAFSLQEVVQKTRQLGLLSDQKYRNTMAIVSLREDLDQREQDYADLMSQRIQEEKVLERLAASCREQQKECSVVLVDIKRLMERQRFLIEKREKAEALITTLSVQGEDLLAIREQSALLEKKVVDWQSTLLCLQEDKKRSEEALSCVRQKVLPMRDREKKLDLEKQEKQFVIRKVEEELSKRELTIEVLKEPAEKSGSIAFLKKELAALEKSIKQLGAVNLTAVEELRSVEERFTYLSDQITDLQTAIVALREVIEKIDQESAALLKKMYTEVNSKLGEFFGVLFEGGEAYLEATDEDFLKARFQIIARPPGKKNKSIHLLSGGEKALTAIAFIFAMFELNPAPFCLLDEVDAPLDDINTLRLTRLIKRMSQKSQMIFISHNKMTMDIADALIGVTMPESGVSKVFDLDIQECLELINQ